MLQMNYVYIFENVLELSVGVISIHSILHILTIVFPDTHNLKYLSIFNGSFQWLT